MAKPSNGKLTFNQQLYYKKYQIKKYYKELKKIFQEDMKQNWEGYLIISGGTMLGFFMLYFIAISQ